MTMRLTVEQKNKCFEHCKKCKAIIKRNLDECDSVFEAVNKTEEDIIECLKHCTKTKKKSIKFNN